MALERNPILKKINALMKNTGRNFQRKIFFVVIVALRYGFWGDCLVSFLVFSNGNTSKDVRSRRRSRHKEMFLQVPERKIVRGPWEKYASKGKKASLTNTVNRRHSSYLENYVGFLILKKGSLILLDN